MSRPNFTTPNTTAMTTTVSHHVIHFASYPVPVVVTSVVSCVLSILGAIVILVTYLKIPEIRNLTRRLILCLTAADFLTCSGYLISVIQYSLTNKDVDSVSCLIQSIVTTYSCLVSFFLTVTIAYHMFVLVIFQLERTTPTRTIVIYNVISWGIPAILIAIAASQRVLGPDYTRDAGTGPWCWIDTSVPRSTFWMLFTGKGWETLCYLLTSSLYVLLKFHLCRQRTVGFSEIHHSLRDEDKNFLYVWLFLYLVRIWGTIRFFLFISGVDFNHIKRLMTGLLYLQAAGDPAQAFVNALLFCVFDKTVRRTIFPGKPTQNIVEKGESGDEKTTLLIGETTAGLRVVSPISGYGTGSSNTMSSRGSSGASTSSEIPDIA